MISTDNRISFKNNSILILVVLNLVLLFSFIWQALQSSHHHLQSSQAVMRDYASIAAHQYIRKVKGNIGYWGLHDLSQQFHSTEASIQSRIRLYFEKDRNLLSKQQLQTRSGIDAIYLYDANTHQMDRLHQQNKHTPPRISDLINSEISGQFSVLHPNDAIGMETLGLFPLKKQRKLVVVFSDQLIQFVLNLNASFEVVLPPTLANKIKTKEGLSIQFKANTRSPAFFIRGNTPDPYLSSTLTVGDDYGGLFKGYILITAIDKKLANQLIIGGLPSNQIPKLLLQIIIAIVLLLLTLWMVKKDKQLSHLKSQFVARVSHELRTPLTQIRVFTESLILNRVQDKETEAKYLNIILRESKRLSFLVDNILTKQQNDQCINPMKLKTLNIHAEINEAVETMQQLMDQNKTKIKVHLEAEIFVYSDANRLRQIILNLLDNSLKYGPIHQTINIQGEI